MSNLTKRIEPIANVAILLLAALIVASFVKEYFHPHDSAEIAAGTKVDLPNMDWARNKQTLLLLLQKGCHFCDESAPFYQKLVGATEGRNEVRLVAVLPQGLMEAKGYLNHLGLAIDDVRVAIPDSLGAKGTPTLILVNSAGTVTDSWIGKLTADQESDVLARLQAEQ